MKICLVAEGSYPYVTGGVSSWVQMLISWMSEHQFVICTIGAQEKDRGKFNYKPPANVCGIKEIFLDQEMGSRGRWGMRVGLKDDEREAFKKLITGAPLEWDKLYCFFKAYDTLSVQSFLMSKDLLDMAKDVYMTGYSHISFADFYFTARSMISPLLNIIKQEIPEADLYHSVSTGYAGILGVLGSVLHRKPFILTEHGIYTREREEEIIKAEWIAGPFKDMWIKHFYHLSGWAYDQADRVISLFNRNKEIQIELGCYAKKIEIIPNGVQVDLFHRVLKKKGMDDHIDDHINVGAVVRVVPIKDIKTMIQGFALAKVQYEKIKFYIMGPIDEDVEYYKECMQMMESIAVDGIVFTGRVDVLEYIGGMDILVLSSISEGQPLAILEGMASGKPFIATDVGSCKELIHGGGDGFGPAGIIVPIMDAKLIGQAIVKLCQDSELRVRMGENGFKRVANLYTKEMLVASYKNLYRSYEGSRLWQV